MRQDIKNHVSIAQSIAPGDYDSTQTGDGVDLANADAAAAVFNFGTVSDDDWTFEVQESDDDGDSDAYAAVDSDFLDGSLPDGPSSDTVAVVGYHGVKRYIRVVATDGGTGDAIFGVAVVRGRLRVKPA